MGIIEFNDIKYEIENGENYINVDNKNNLVEVFKGGSYRIASTMESFVNILSRANKNFFSNKNFLTSLDKAVFKLLIETEKSKEQKYEFINVYENILEEKQNQLLGKSIQDQKNQTLYSLALSNGIKINKGKNSIISGKFQWEK